MPLLRRAISIFFPLLLLAATLIAYIPVMAHPIFIWDDDAYVYENPVYRAPDALRQIWFVPTASPQYYPIVFTTFYIERQLYGLNPLGYHLINILLHAGSAILLWLVLKRLRVPGAMLAAAVFTLHPMMVESVAWVTERKNTLSMFFFLASLLAFIRFALPEMAGEPDAGGNNAAPTSQQKIAHHWFCYGLSLFFFIIALLSKSVACGLAPVLVLLLWWQRSRLPKAGGIHGLFQYLLTIPYFVLGAASGLYTAHLEQTQVGAQGDAWQLHFPEKILLASQAIWFYIYKLLFPAQLSFYYWRWPIDPSIWWQWLFPMALLAVLILLILFRKRIGDWPLAAAIAFVALLFPALGFFPLYPMLFSWVADHFAYLATLAFIPAICAAAVLAARRWLPNTAMQMALAATLLVALGVKTFITAQNYQSLEALWTSVLLYDTDHPNWNALIGLSHEKRAKAWAAVRRGQHDEAIIWNEQAKLLDDEALQVRPGYGIALNNLALYHLFKGEDDQAIAFVEKAIKADPAEAAFYVTLGDIYFDLKQWDKAAPAYLQGVQLNPNKAFFQFKAARAFHELGQDDRARLYIANTLYLDPNYSDAHVLLGTILAQHDDLPNATEEFRTAVRDDPSNLEAANSFIKAVYSSRGASSADVDAALALARRNVDETQGANFEYFDTLAMALSRAGRVGDAITLLQQELPQVPPSDVDTRQRMLRHLAAWSPEGTMAAPATTRAAR